MRLFVNSIIQVFLLQVVHAQSVTKLHVDIDNFNGGTVSEVFKNVHFIPLETTKESIVGTITQLEVTEDNFIISDVQTNSIFFFNREGQFEFKIKAHKPDRFIGNFAIDEINNKLVVQTEVDVINVFDLKGNYIKRVKLPFTFRSVFLFKNGTILYNVDKPSKAAKEDTTLYDLRYATDYDHFFEESFPYNPKVEFWEYNTFTNPFPHISGNDSVLFSLPFHYNIYALHDTGIYHIYKFLFPAKYSVPINFNSKKFAGKKIDFLFHHKENVNKIIGLEEAYKLGDNLLFTIRIRGAEARKYAYNLNTSSLISFDHIVGDSSSYFMPILRFYEGMEAVFHNHIYSSMPTFVVDKVNKNKPLNHYCPALEAYFKNHDKWTNPFIIEADLKDNL